MVSAFSLTLFDAVLIFLILVFLKLVGLLFGEHLSAILEVHAVLALVQNFIVLGVVLGDGFDFGGEELIE